MQLFPSLYMTCSIVCNYVFIVFFKQIDFLNPDQDKRHKQLGKAAIGIIK